MLSKMIEKNAHDHLFLCLGLEKALLFTKTSWTTWRVYWGPSVALDAFLVGF